MRTTLIALAIVTLGLGTAAPSALAANVKVTPLGGQDGEFCKSDRALIFEDPNGTRILYAAGRTVAGPKDPRLGKIESSPSQAASDEVRIYHEEAKNHPLGQYHDSAKKLKTVEGSEATLAITKKGAFVYLLTRQLTPGNVYTLWFGVYNKPENCKASPCDVKDFLDHAAITKPDMGYADGLIAGADGTAKFSAYIPVGKLRQGWYGNGFQNPQSGEIHLVLHDHGRLIPERAANMLGTYRGGCTTDSLFEGFPEISKSDGQPGPNECNLLQLVRFVQDPK